MKDFTMQDVFAWIDEQDAKTRDRLITHPEPSQSCDTWWDDQLDCGCLLGTKYPGWAKYVQGLDLVSTTNSRPTSHEIQLGSTMPTIIFEAYECDYSQFWADVKAYAAKHNKIDLGETAPEPTKKEIL